MSGSPPELVWGVFTRLLGVVYLLAFVPLVFQVTALAGQHGVLPVGVKLAALRRDFSAPRRFLHFPTLLFVAHGDLALRLLAGIGIAAAIVIVVGGPASPIAFAVAYASFLSFDVALALSLPWECVLLEAGVLALFLPATRVVPELGATAAPAPALAWAYRLLLFRIVFGFGKFKFIGSTRRDWSYLHGFLINQPLPTIVAWYAHRLPLWVLRVGVLSLFWAEIPSAFLSLVPGPVGLIGGAGILGLMVVIHLCGNFGYFNWIVAALCVPLLDFQTPLALDLRGYLSAGAPLVTNAFVAVHTLGALLYLPFNSYVSQNWHRWALWSGVRPRILVLPVRLLSALAGFRWLHSYGVFPPKSMAPVRNIAVVEVSWDGESWHELEYAHAATRPEHRPRFMAPFMMRWEQMLIYETHGTTAYALAYSVANGGFPYAHAPRSDSECLMQRILEGHFYEDIIFKRGTFARREPPKLVRMRLYMLVPTTPADRRHTGNYWSRQLIGPHYAARGLEPDFWQLWLPEPELFDFDDVVWKRRSRLGRMMARAARPNSTDSLETVALLGESTVDNRQSTVDESELCTRAELDRFFDEVLPMVHADRAEDWSQLPAVHDALSARYSTLELRTFERILARLQTALVSRLEPHLFGDRAPRIELPTHYHLALFCQYLIGRGRNTAAEIFQDPARVVSYVAELTLEKGMFLSAVFRLYRIAWEAHKIRLLDAMLARSSERFPESERAEYERNLETMAKRIWGIAHVTPLLRARFREPEFCDGAPERYPDFVELPSGVIAERRDGA